MLEAASWWTRSLEAGLNALVALRVKDAIADRFREESVLTDVDRKPGLTSSCSPSRSPTRLSD